MSKLATCSTCTTFRLPSAASHCRPTPETVVEVNCENSWKSESVWNTKVFSGDDSCLAGNEDLILDVHMKIKLPCNFIGSCIHAFQQEGLENLLHTSC